MTKMIEYADSLADFFKIVGDATRIKILYALLDGKKCVGELANILNMNQSAISHQLRILKQYHLAKCEKNGRSAIYSLDDEHVVSLLEKGYEHFIHKKG